MPNYTTRIHAGRDVTRDHLDRTCIVEHCEDIAPEDVRMQLCVAHLRKAHAAYLIVTQDDPEIGLRKPVQEPERKRSNMRGTVYFILLHDGLIKIGWTSNMKNRMSNLQPTSNSPHRTRHDG